MDEYKKLLEGLSEDELKKKVAILIEDAKLSEKYAEDPSFREQVASLEASLADYEDKIREEEIQKMMHEIEMESLIRQVDESYDELRRTLLDEIAKGGEQVEGLKKIARQLIQVEKDHEQYDPENWPGFEE